MDSLHEFIHLKVQVIEKISELQKFVESEQLSESDRVHYTGILDELNVGIERLVLSVLMEIGEVALAPDFEDFEIEEEDPLDTLNEISVPAEGNVYDFASHKKRKDTE